MKQGLWKGEHLVRIYPDGYLFIIEFSNQSTITINTLDTPDLTQIEEL